MSGILGATPTLDEAPPVPVAKPATMGEAFDAQRILSRGDRMDAEAERLRRGYEPLLAEINADRATRGLKPLVNPGYWTGDLERRPSADRGPFDFASILDARVDRRQQQAAIFGELRAIRARKPKFLAGVPEDDRSFYQGLIETERGARDRARERLANSSAIGGTLAGFAGGVVETMHDPVNLFSLPLGGGGKTLWAQVGRSILVNGGLEAIQQPQVAAGREVLGEELTTEEALLNVGFAAAGGVVGDVVIPRAGRAAIDAADAAYRRLRPGGYIANALARAELPDDALASRFADLVPEDVRSFDERAALNVITRESEVRGSSPFVPTPEGQNAHAGQLQATIDALLDAEPGPAIRGTTPTPRETAPRRTVARGGAVASDIVGFFRSKGYSEAQARGIAAGIHAEAASNHAAVNPTSGAMGLGQWLGARKAALIARYGPRPTRAQQLEFLHWELQGGDAGGRAVLAGIDEAGVLDAYIRRFMRPAAGAETDGDLARGMAALGRESEEILPGLEPDSAPIVRPAELDAVRSPIDGPELVEVATPELRRDAFPDETSWRAAQEANDAEALGLPAPRARGRYRDAQPVDALKFIARAGGLTPSGERGGGRAHDLRTIFETTAVRRSKTGKGALSQVKATSYKTTRFIPGAGPLIRETGMTLDEAGERLWEAGYFGPSATTPRPTVDEVLQLLEANHHGERKFSIDDIDRVTANSAANERAREDRDWREAHLMLTRFDGIELDEDALGRWMSISNERGISPEESWDAFIDGEFADAHADLLAELEALGYAPDHVDPYGSFGAEGRDLGEGGGRSAPEPGDPGPQPESSDLRQSLAEGWSHSDAVKAFDDPSGEGATQQADSLIHDLRARLGAEELDADLAARLYRLEDGSEKSAAEILADLDEDEAMLAAIKGCL